jgi:hypothetical protein
MHLAQSNDPMTATLSTLDSALTELSHAWGLARHARLGLQSLLQRRQLASNGITPKDTLLSDHANDIISVAKSRYGPGVPDTGPDIRALQIFPDIHFDGQDISLWDPMAMINYDGTA